MTLIPIEDLRRAEERYYAERAEEQRKRHQQDVEASRERELAQPHTEQAVLPPPIAPLPTTPPAATVFEYVPRTPEQWERDWEKRMRQSWKTNRSYHPKWPKPAPKPRKSRASFNH